MSFAPPGQREAERNGTGSFMKFHLPILIFMPTGAGSGNDLGENRKTRKQNLSARRLYLSRTCCHQGFQLSLSAGWLKTNIRYGKQIFPGLRKIPSAAVNTDCYPDLLMNMPKTEVAVLTFYTASTATYGCVTDRAAR
jgi:hypothetical protein